MVNIFKKKKKNFKNISSYQLNIIYLGEQIYINDNLLNIESKIKYIDMTKFNSLSS